MIGAAAGSADDAEAVYAILTHLAANGRAMASDDVGPAGRTFRRGKAARV
jgi:hypothetical protein